MPVLQTPRLVLRPFREEDVALLATLMATADFMRFSLGVFSRKQTVAFLDKIIDWQRARFHRNSPSFIAPIID
jgi:RimJ/RimL family protein N-acetyltransferase